MISVIIPVKNGAATIHKCLQAALAQEGLEQSYEVLVVDDGSTDNTRLLAEQMGVQVISQPNAGPAAARNTGASAARGELLVYTDADCEPSPDWLRQISDPFINPEIIAAKGAYRTRQQSLVARFVQQEYESKYARMRGMAYIDFVDTYSAAYRRETFLQNGGFDPAFPIPSVEDQEFSFRLARKGYRMVFVPQATVFHKHDESTIEYYTRKYSIGYWKAFMLRWVPEKAFSDSHTLSSQRWQIVLLALTGGTAVLGFVWSWVWWLALISMALFYATSLPFLTQISRQDPPVLWVAPLLLLLRSLAQVLGLTAGFLTPPARANRPSVGLGLLSRLVKRSLDVVGGVIGLLFSTPVILAAAAAIKLDDGGPVFYIQERAGENGKPFRLFKLRTMQVGADRQIHQMLENNPLNGPVFKFPNDPRVTRVGRFLRRWSLDEVPQLWNIVRGDMSLVGPRPEETWVVALYTDEQRQRLVVKPGLTGPMQVSGRGELDLQERLTLELEYINHYSVWKDITFLVRTLPAVVRGKGAF